MSCFILSQFLGDLDLSVVFLNSKELQSLSNTKQFILDSILKEKQGFRQIHRADVKVVLSVCDIEWYGVSQCAQWVVPRLLLGLCISLSKQCHEVLYLQQQYVFDVRIMHAVCILPSCISNQLGQRTSHATHECAHVQRFSKCQWRGNMDIKMVNGVVDTGVAKVYISINVAKSWCPA